MDAWSGDEPVTTNDLLRRLDELQELFRRRLLDDREKRILLDDLHDRARRAEEGVALEYLLPLIYRLTLIVDRLDAYQGDDRAFAASLRAELLQALHQHGVESLEPTGPVDPAWHETISITGEPPGELIATQVVQRGFRYGSRLLRPARVQAEFKAPTRRGTT